MAHTNKRVIRASRAYFVRFLPPCGLHGHIKLMFGGVQVFFGAGAVAFHIEVVSGAGSVHLVDRFLHVFMNFVQIVPIVHLGRDCNAGEK